MPSVLTFCETMFSNRVEVANTISCLPYIVLGFITLYRSIRFNNTHRYRHLIWGILVIWLGLASMLLHTTKTQIGLILDLSAMVLVVIYTWDQFFYKHKPLYSYLLYLIYTSLLLGSLYWHNSDVLMLCFLIFSLSWLGYELLKKKSQAEAKLLTLGLFVMLIGFIFWLMDYTKSLCNENSISFIYGHSIWHIATSISLYYLYRLGALRISRDIKQ